MTQTEIATLRNVIARLKQLNCGCCNDLGTEELVTTANARGLQVVSRIYLDSWVIPALELLLPGAKRDPKLAAQLSG